MKIKYEGAIFDFSLTEPYELNMIRQSLKNPIKKIIGSWLGKPYKQDEVLEYLFSRNISNPIVIDVGCHIGTVSIPIAKKLPNAKIFCIDAYPPPLAKLIKNINLNHLKNIHVINAAISESSDLLNIYPCLETAAGARVTGFKGRANENDGGEVMVSPVSITALFSYYELNYCDLLKIDIEGYELSALRSAGEFLKPSIIKNVIAEYGPEGCRSAGITGWDIVEYMLARGYKCKDIHSKKEIKNVVDMPLVKDFNVTDFLFYSS